MMEPSFRAPQVRAMPTETASSSAETLMLQPSFKLVLLRTISGVSGWLFHLSRSPWVRRLRDPSSAQEASQACCNTVSPIIDVAPRANQRQGNVDKEKLARVVGAR